MPDYYLGLSTYHAKWLGDLLKDYYEQEEDARAIFHMLQQCMSSSTIQSSAIQENASGRPHTPNCAVTLDYASPMNEDSSRAPTTFTLVDSEDSPGPVQLKPTIRDTRRVIPIQPSPTKVKHLTPYLEPSVYEGDYVPPKVNGHKRKRPEQEAEDGESGEQDYGEYAQSDGERDMEEMRNEQGHEELDEEETKEPLWGPEWDEDYGEDGDVLPATVPEKQVLSSISKGILIKVAELSRLLLSPNELENIEVISAKTGFNMMFGVSERAKTGSLHMLAVLANACFNLEMSEAAIRFRYMISIILFRLSVHNAVLQHGVSRNKILENLSIIPGVKVSLTKLNRYSAEGGKFCLLTGAGSIYVIALIAAVSNKSELMAFTGDEVARVATLLRCPYPDYPEGDLIVKFIIPAIAYLRQQYTFVLPTNLTLPVSWHLNLSNGFDYGQVDCQDLAKTDRLMDSLSYDCFVKGRDDTTWASCLTAVSSLAFSSPIIPPVIPFNSTPEEGPYIIQCQFDINAEANRKVKFNRGSDNKSMAERLQFTEQERQKASKYKSSPILPKFAKMYQNFLSDGYAPEGDDTYWYFHRRFWEKRGLLVEGKNNEFLFYMTSGLSKDVKSGLCSAIRTVFMQDFKWLDSSLRPEDPFKSLHMSFYNRYSKQRPPNADSNEDPSTLTDNNTATFIPRASQELKNNAARYCLLQQLLAPVFGFVDRMVYNLLPNVHKKLKKFTSNLPGNEISPASPFSAFVLNLNASTQIHRDWNDSEICVVLAITDPTCTGGELVLVEPRAVIPLQHGDIIMFRSSEISHFNLHFKGYRASLVLHSDRHSLSWVDKRNGWVYHDLFTTLRKTFNGEVVADNGSDED
ncbi:hypothetical protein BDN72DRAFT_905580 [Pluteus cervinus]|uniref:Uncharacterized protein n=1 Tax=Pluteus cervinus TaxID=181527 RepID=A0ACD3A232_9AGAR|nr:hypothetical protein BDN72DRAFT_905580 [Pluteus cervinus]